MSTSSHVLNPSAKSSVNKNTFRHKYHKPKRRKNVSNNKKSKQNEIEHCGDLLVKHISPNNESAQQHQHDINGSNKKPATVRNVRRGIFYASELLQHKEAKAYEREFGCLEKVSLIRFPPCIARELRQRLMSQFLEIESFCSSSTLSLDDYGGHDIFASQSKSDLTSNLGLTVTPSAEEDYRVFNFAFQKTWGDPSSEVQLRGVLFELPCLLEVYKSLEDELLFKCNDISQLLYVYYKDHDPPFNISTKSYSDLWEWKSGLTSGTHRIRSRRFKNFHVFEKSDVSQAEAHLCNVLNSEGVTETVTLEASTVLVMESEIDSLFHGSETNKKNLISIIRPDNPIFKASLMGASPKEAATHFQDPIMGSSEPLTILDNAQNFSFPKLEERLAFNTMPNCQIDINEPVPDNLSDYLFGEVEKYLEESEDLDPIEQTTYDHVIEETFDDDNYFQTLDEPDNFDAYKEDFE